VEQPCSKGSDGRSCRPSVVGTADVLKKSKFSVAVCGFAAEPVDMILAEWKFEYM